MNVNVNSGTIDIALLVLVVFFLLSPFFCLFVCLFVCLLACLLALFRPRSRSISRFFENGTLELVRDLHRSLVSLRADRVQIGGYF